VGGAPVGPLAGGVRPLAVAVLLALGCGGLPMARTATPQRRIETPAPKPVVPTVHEPLSHTVLVTGFGAFLDVKDNPSGRLAAAVDGAQVEGWTVVGKVLEVSYAGAPARTIAAAKANHAGLIIGLGVDTSRDGVFVERCGYAGGDGVTVDIDDVTRGPAEGKVRATIDVDRFAHALGAEVSEDPGRYVCNSWLYDVRTGLPDRPVGFVHLPANGIEKDRFLMALGELVRSL
jgi:pyroglutamyl-peptidase